MLESCQDSAYDGRSHPEDAVEVVVVDVAVVGWLWCCSGIDGLLLVVLREALMQDVT